MYFYIQLKAYKLELILYFICKKCLLTKGGVLCDLGGLVGPVGVDNVGLIGGCCVAPEGGAEKPWYPCMGYPWLPY